MHGFSRLVSVLLTSLLAGVEGFHGGPLASRPASIGPMQVRGGGWFTMSATSDTASLTLKKVLVTGAAGKTGRLVLEKLQNLPGMTGVGLVRRDKSVKDLEKALGIDPLKLVVGSTLDGAILTKAMEGCDAVILCTSASPRPVFFSLIKAIVRKFFGRPRKAIKFQYPKGGEPEQVDWLGAKAQIDAAKAAGVKHFVIVSSMGGTDNNHMLNTMGRRSDGTGGNILLWKRRAERYLIEQCKDGKMTYTIIHPGGLTDKPGNEGEILLDVDDKLLLKNPRSIPRADVAELCIQSLFNPEAHNKSFDTVVRPDGPRTQDFKAVFATLKDISCNYAGDDHPILATPF